MKVGFPEIWIRSSRRRWIQVSGIWSLRWLEVFEQGLQGSQIRADGWQSESEVPGCLWMNKGFRIIWRSLCTLAQTLFLRSGFGPQGDDESRSQELRGLRNQVPKSKSLLWELYAHQILRLGSLRMIWTLFGVKDPEQVPDHCQIIARSLPGL